jgi:uncharacterized protein (TIGR03435 family)
VNALLEGRITTTRPTQATFKAFSDSNLVILGAEPTKMSHPEDNRPHFPPSFVVHVSPSQGDDRGNFSGPDFRVLKGYKLKEAIQELYGVNPIRVYLPAALDLNKSYDFALLLPQPESHEDMGDRVRRGIEAYFHVSATIEKRWSDVYVVTSTERKPPLAKARTEEGAFFGVETVGFETPSETNADPTDPKPVSLAGLRSIHAEGTVDKFCQTLESALDRPVVNETNLQGEFEFNAESSEGTENDFLERLRDRLGLSIAPAQRNIDVLVFRTR